jgi:hypothetical protein
MHVVLAALGYVSDVSSKATVMEVQRKFDEAVANGRMVRNGIGDYSITREYYDRQVKRNSAWSRARRRDQVA